MWRPHGPVLLPLQAAQPPVALPTFALAARIEVLALEVAPLARSMTPEYGFTKVSTAYRSTVRLHDRTTTAIGYEDVSGTTLSCCAMCT